MWNALQGVAGVFAWHLAFLAQPGDMPQRLIAADPDAFFGHFLDQ
jgi:haloacetate dehalogenase